MVFFDLELNIIEFKFNPSGFWGFGVLGFWGFGAETTAEIVREFSGLSEILRERYMRTRLTHPSNWAIEQGTSLAVYAIIRLVKPEKVLETGVANGHSSFFILKGLELNRRGVLYSVDINPAVGPLLSDEERRDWNLSVLPKSRRKDALKRFARRISPIDVFIHDSNHLYYWQMFEFRLAFELLRRGGYLLVDDCDCSFAFLDFAQKHGLSPQFLLDRRKLFGVVRVYVRTPERALRIKSNPLMSKRCVDIPLGSA